MKSKDSVIVFWSAAAIVLAAVVEWLLVRMALADNSKYGLGWGAWVVPVLFLPLLSAAALHTLRKMKSRRERLLAVKLIVICLPLLGLAAVTGIHGGPHTQTAGTLICAVGLFLVSVWYSKRKMVIAQNETDMPAS